MGPASETGASAPRRLILGTAGHIDHGKTALCRALTGVDTDRLPEEKQRGITIELGFAPLDLPDGTRLGVVDVPGHEGLVRTMVAGAVGIDLLLLVVAADEGVMPQTREHLAICRLLGIDRALVALTKRDLVDEEVAALAREEVAELLAPTPLADAPILAVSATRGDGIEELRAALAALAAETPARTPRRGPPRLPVDRCFEMRGFGPVVTGTLVGGALRVGDAVVLLPGAERARVRGLQCHGEKVEVAEPGLRCAVNLQGVALESLSRGMVVSHPDVLTPTGRLDVELDWLPEAPPVAEPTPVSLLCGTGEHLARLAPIGAAQLVPGKRGLARLHVEGEPVVALPGDRFVLRGFARTALGATLGGGRVLDAHPPPMRRSDPGLRRDLEALQRGDADAALAVRVGRAGLAGVSRTRLARELGLDSAEIDALVDAARAAGALALAGPRVIDATALGRLEDRLRGALEAYHRAEPLRPGMPVASLRGVLPENVPAETRERVIEGLVGADAIVVEGEHVRLASHRPRLDARAEACCEQILARLGEAGLEAPSLRDLGSALGVEEPALRDLLAHLERSGAIVAAPGDLWFEARAVEALRERVRRHFAEHESLDTPSFKTLIGTTRRTAVPLMELLDAEKLTVRRGELRRRGRGA